MNNVLSKRRNIFINKAFQGRFIASVLLMIVLFGLCSAGLIYWLISDDLHSQSQSAHVNIVNAWQRLGLSILIGNMVAAVVAGLTSVIVVLYISHKLAGPLYRFETLCEQVGNGNLDGAANLRQSDQLQELARAFSDMVSRLRQRRDKQRDLIGYLQNQLASLKSTGNLTADQNEILHNLQAKLKEFE